MLKIYHKSKRTFYFYFVIASIKKKSKTELYLTNINEFKNLYTYVYFVL